MAGRSIGERLREEEYRVSTWEEVNSRVRDVFGSDCLLERIACEMDEVGTDYFCITGSSF